MKVFKKSFLFIVLISMMMSSCANSGDAKVSVTVVNAGTGLPVDSAMVVMYRGVPSDTIYTMYDSLSKVDSAGLTDKNGHIEFTVKSMSIGEVGTYRIFETFETKDSVNLGKMTGRVYAFISSGARRISLTLKQE